MKTALPRIVAFVAITLGLTLLWEVAGQALYGRFLKAVAPAVYDLIGFGGARVGALRERYVNFIPFIGLVLVTPHLPPRRRAAGLVLGLFALFCGHLALNLTEIGTGRGRPLPIVASLLSDTLPFLVWLVVAAPALGHWLPGDPGATAVAPSDVPPATAIERSSTPDA